MHDDDIAIKGEADRIHRIFAMLASPFEGERVNARGALERLFATNGRHPSDFKILPATTKTGWDDFDRLHKAHKKEIASLRKKLKLANDLTRVAQQERDQLRQENRALKQRLDAALNNDVLSLDLETPMRGLIGEQVLDLSSAEISKRIAALLERRITARHNVCAEIDMPLGKLGLALLHDHARQFGKRKRRGSNTPSKTEWLKLHASRDPSWIRKCIRAVIAVNDANLDLREAHSIEEILRVQRQARASQS
jgi:hypothetical protein